MEFLKEFLYYGYIFMVYAFIGWIIENLYCFYKTRHFQKMGFLIGPFKPMYAIAMSLLVFIYHKYSMSIQSFIFFCFLIPTTVEYATGELMRGYFKVDYWDYSELKYNYRGIISFRFSIYWMFLTFIGVRYFNYYLVDYLYKIISPYWVFIGPILMLLLVIDDVLSVIVLRKKKPIV